MATLSYDEIQALVPQFKAEVWDKLQLGKNKMNAHDMAIGWALGKGLHPFDARTVGHEVLCHRGGWK